MLKEGGTVWGNLLDGAYIPAISQPALAASRATLKSAMDATGRNMKRDGGIRILGSGDQEGARDLLGQLNDYGIFVVADGEIEFWLKSLGATGHGSSWLIDVFERMGEDPELVSYLKPGDDDVWKFLSEVKSWLVQPNRKGIPT